MRSIRLKIFKIRLCHWQGSGLLSQPHFFPIESACLFSGAPTAIAQSCPGCPCGGFIPGAVTTGAGGVEGVEGAAGGTVTGANGFGANEGVGMPDDGEAGTSEGAGAGAGAGGVAGGESSEAPTLISQRCPGCPCGGFVPGAVAVV